MLEKKEYKIEFWSRQTGNGTVKFIFTGSYSKSPNKIKPIIFKVKDKWKKYEATFTPPDILHRSKTGAMILELSGPTKIHIDNFRVYRADTDYLALLPREKHALKSAKLHALRTHRFIKSKFSTYDMEQITNPGGVINGTHKLNTLIQTLNMMHEINVNPWLQIEYHMNPDEWLAFVEYMAATYNPTTDTPQKKPGLINAINNDILNLGLINLKNIFRT